MQINIDLSKLHDIVLDKFYPLLKNKDRFLLMRGSAGSGKSTFAAQKILLRILVGYSSNVKHRFLCIRDTSKDNKVSTFFELKKIIDTWGVNDLVRINKASLDMVFTNGSEIIFAGCDDVEKLKSIGGITGIWIEEATQVSLFDFKQINLRLRAFGPYAQIMLSFNPITRMNWIFKNFYRIDKNSTFLHHSTWQDNKFLPEGYIEELLSDEDDYFRQVYAEGEWGIQQNLIYTKWKVLVDWPKLKSFDQVVYGIDVGFRVPSTLIFVGIKDEDIYVKELIYEKGHTHEEFITRMKEVIVKHRDSIPMYFDNAEPALIQAARQAGFWALPADKAVNNGIHYLKTRNIYIDRGSKGIQDEIQMYKWKEDKSTEVIIPENPVKMFDHALDAIRYASYSAWGKKQSFEVITG